MPILDRIEAAGRDAWLRFVKWINGSLAALTAAVVAAYKTYPDAVKHFAENVPWWLAVPGMVSFFLVVNHALKRAKDAS